MEMPESQDAGQTDKGSKLTSKHIVLERALAAGEDIRARLERWTAEHVAPDSHPMDGPWKRGYTEREVEHILTIVEIVKRLGSERPRNAEIAFWLAYYGFDVPGTLILQYVKYSVESVLGFLKSDLDKRGPLDVEGATDENPDVLQRPVVRLMLKVIGLTARKGPVRDVVEIGVRLSLRALFQRARPTLPTDGIQSLVNLFRKSDATTATADQLADTTWSLIQEGMKLFDLDEKHNILLRAIEEVSKGAADTLVLRSCRDSKIIVDTCGVVIPWIDDNYSLSNAPGTQPGLGRRFTAPAMAALFLLLRDHPEAQKQLSQWRSGQADTIVTSLNQLKTIGEQLKRLH